MNRFDPQRPWQLPPHATEVLLVRHGSSMAGRRDIPFEVVEGGHADPPLAPEGHAQAERVGRRLLVERPDALFVTPQKRTSQTAAPLVAATGMTPVLVRELREVFLGEWEGVLRRRLAEGDPLLSELFEKQRWDVIPGAEPMEAFAERVRAGLERVVEATGQGRRAVVFTHGGVIAELCHQATGSRRLAFVNVENASITRMVWFPGGHLMLRSFNDTTHLRTLARPAGAGASVS
jgi:probable phosphoglycerate mutase